MSRTFVKRYEFVFVIIALLAFITVSMCSCNDDITNDNIQTGGEFLQPYYLVVISDDFVFSADDEVNFTIAFGHIGSQYYPDDESLEMDYSVTVTPLGDEPVDYITSHVNDFSSLKYKITPVFDENNKTRELIFSYYENLVFSRELLGSWAGSIEFLLEINTENLRARVTEKLSYRVEDNVVTFKKPKYKQDGYNGIKYSIVGE